MPDMKRHIFLMKDYLVRAISGEYNEDIDIKCEFCRREFIFKRGEIMRLLYEMH
jgi:hypothetical protein